MAFSCRELFCPSETFCCCLPVRIGVIVISFLETLLAGVLSIVLWFEFVSSPHLIDSERVAFVFAALVETTLSLASVLGFVGAVVQKQVFVQAYAYFIYVHFLLNVGVAAFLLSSITRFSTKINAEACQATQDQCTGILKVATWVYYAVAAFVLLVEFYVVLITTCYLAQIKSEKLRAEALRMENEAVFGLVSGNKSQYSGIPGGQNMGVFGHGDFDAEEFDPYELNPQPHERPRETEWLQPSVGPSSGDQYDGVGAEELGYGGGFWTHREISDQEKVRLEKRLAMEDECLPKYV